MEAPCSAATASALRRRLSVRSSGGFEFRLLLGECQNPVDELAGLGRIVDRHGFGQQRLEASGAERSWAERLLVQLGLQLSSLGDRRFDRLTLAEQIRNGGPDVKAATIRAWFCSAASAARSISAATPSAAADTASRPAVVAVPIVCPPMADSAPPIPSAASFVARSVVPSRCGSRRSC